MSDISAGWNDENVKGSLFPPFIISQTGTGRAVLFSSEVSKPVPCRSGLCSPTVSLRSNRPSPFNILSCGVTPTNSRRRTFRAHSGGLRWWHTTLSLQNSGAIQSAVWTINNRAVVWPCRHRRHHGTAVQAQDRILVRIARMQRPQRAQDVIDIRRPVSYVPCAAYVPKNITRLWRCAAQRCTRGGGAPLPIWTADPEKTVPRNPRTPYEASQITGLTTGATTIRITTSFRTSEVAIM